MATLDQAFFQFLGWNTQGDLGPLTMYTDKRGQLVFFAKMPPLNPPSIRQTIQRDNFTSAAILWRALTPQQRDAWERATHLARLRIPGYNLFVYWSLTGDSATINTIENQTGLTLLT